MIGDGNNVGQQDLIVYANFNLDNGASTNLQVGNETDAPGLILMDPGGIRITPNTGTVLEVGPTFYDPVNATLIRIGNSIFLDGDGVTNTIRSGDGAVATDPGEQIFIRSGNGNTTGAGGLLQIESGAGGATSGASGDISIYSGSVTSGSNSGSIDFGTNNAAGAGQTGAAFFGTGDSAGSGDSGLTELYSGDSTSGSSGFIRVSSGDAGVTVGDVILLAGTGPAGGNVVLESNGSVGAIQFDGRAQCQQGVDIASANDITLNTGNFFSVTGNTTINRIATANWRAGSVVYFEFASNPTISNGVAAGGGFASILLNGTTNFTTTAGSTLTLLYNGTSWVEFGRMTR